MLVGTCNKDYDNENVVQDKIGHYMHSSTSQQLVSQWSMICLIEGMILLMNSKKMGR